MVVGGVGVQGEEATGRAGSFADEVDEEETQACPAAVRLRTSKRRDSTSGCAAQ